MQRSRLPRQRPLPLRILAPVRMNLPTLPHPAMRPRGVFAVLWHSSHPARGVFTVLRHSGHPARGAFAVPRHSGCAACTMPCRVFEACWPEYCRARGRAFRVPPAQARQTLSVAYPFVLDRAVLLFKKLSYALGRKVAQTVSSLHPAVQAQYCGPTSTFLAVQRQSSL